MAESSPTELEGHEIAITYNGSNGERTITVEVVEVSEYGTNSHLVRAAEPSARRSRFVRFVDHERGPSTGLLKSENSKAKRGRGLGLIEAVEDLGPADVPLAEAFEAVKKADYGDVVSFAGEELVRDYSGVGRTFEEPQTGERVSVYLRPGGVLISGSGLENDRREYLREAEHLGRHPDAADRDDMTPTLREYGRGDAITVNGTEYVVVRRHWRDFNGRDPVCLNLTEAPWHPDDGHAPTDATLWISWDGLEMAWREERGEPYHREPATIGEPEAITDGGQGRRPLPEPGSREAPRIGIDREGCTHYHDDEHDRMLLTQSGDVVEVHDLEGRGVEAWIEHVRTRRGWEVCFWEQRGFTGVCRAIGRCAGNRAKGGAVAWGSKQT